METDQYKSENEIVTTVNDNIIIAEPVNGQRFGTDALLLAAFAKSSPRSVAAELGTGSGIVSLLCAGRGKFAYIDAVEVQPALAELCGRNIERNGFADRITPHCADAREFCRLPERAGAYDAVLFNPPYMRPGDGLRSDDFGRDAARRELHGDIFELCGAAAKLLRTGGLFYTVYRPDRAADLICALRGSTLEPKRIIFVCDEADNAPCLMLTESRKGAGVSARVTPPFVLRCDGKPSPDFAFLLENGEFPGKYL